MSVEDDGLAALIRRRIESRYRRMCFVHGELRKLDAAADQAPAGSFDDFVFSHIDFSIYQKIEAGEFTLLFDSGLDDYEEAFFTASFTMSRNETRALINKSYVKAGPWFLRRNPHPLLLPVMRTLHTALTFAPLVPENDCANPAELADALDGVVIRHDDGMETLLVTPRRGSGRLRGVFHPLGKAYTIDLL
ncbi:MAG: hypothetical protein LBN92_07510 [Treponema sp.]|jgi:hypothetical protein|nr:hypothetical protein [Treponema sp.]